jgi:hypothetical protein
MQKIVKYHADGLQRCFGFLIQYPYTSSGTAQVFSKRHAAGYICALLD